MDTVNAERGACHLVAELRIILLGHRGSGKSSAGNTILGMEAFDNTKVTVKCVENCNTVAGKKVTVVDTQSWIKGYSVKDIPELYKQRLMGSVFLCPPGPHAFLLVIDVSNTFTGEHRRAYEEHVELFSESVWRHCMVLFTQGHTLGSKTIEQHIKSEGQTLQRLVGRCGNRYHLLNNKDRGDQTQVIRLLEKIEEMVRGNGDQHYELDSKITMELAEKRKDMERKVKARLMKVETQREADRALMGDAPQLLQLRIVVLGWRGAGKSSVGNTILGRVEFQTGGGTTKCDKKEGHVAGRQVIVVDTPGWFIGHECNTPELDKQHVLYSLSLCPPGPHVLLLIVPTVIPFTENFRRSVVDHLEGLGESIWRHCLVLFGGGDKLAGMKVEQHIETEGDALQWLIDKCRNRYHVVNNKDPTDCAQVTELLDKLEEMVAGNLGCHFEMDIRRSQELRNRQRAAKERHSKVQCQREALQKLIKGQRNPLTELRMVILGSVAALNRTIGNVILGVHEYKDREDISRCRKRQALVVGRQVTVVETPAWNRGMFCTETDYILAAHGVSECPPGPHALLLAVPLFTSFNKFEKRRVQQQMGLLGENVWKHTIVLFGFDKKLEDITIELLIESEESALKWLVEKCGNRYYVLNTDNQSDTFQVTGLLESIEEMVAGNGSCHYEIDSQIVKEVEEKMRCMDERAKQRQIQRSSGSLNSEYNLRCTYGLAGDGNAVQEKELLRPILFLPENKQEVSELRILLLGCRKSGKSSSGNTILGRERFKAGQRTGSCVEAQGVVGRWRVTVVDTPGLCYFGTIEHVPHLLKQQIVHSMSLCEPGPHVVLLNISLILTFSEGQRHAIQEQVSLLGEKIWGHTILLFTFGDILNSTDLFFEKCGKSLQWLIETCGNRYHVFKNLESGDDSQVRQLLEMAEELVLANSGAHFEMDHKVLRSVKKKLKETSKKAEERLKELQTESEEHTQAEHLREIRLVLLGQKRSGKRTVGNLILGREEFAPGGSNTNCLKGQGEAFGRLVTVVTTPGWTLKILGRLLESNKQKLRQSTSLCLPGPQAFLLVISLRQSFTHSEKMCIQEHLEAFGEQVWDYIIIVFNEANGGDWLGDMTIEQHIESEGEALQQIVKKCKNRYHVLNLESKCSDTNGVMKLLEKIEKVVALNNGCDFEMKSNVLHQGRETLEEMKTEEETEIKLSRNLDTSRTSEGERHPSEIRILLLGLSGDANNLTGNTILGRQVFGSDRTAPCMMKDGQVKGRKITVVDTPGLTFPPKNTPKMVKQEIVHSVSLCPPGPHVILFVMNMLNYVTLFEEHLRPFGESVWSHCLVLFTQRETLGIYDIEQYIQSRGNVLQGWLEKCGNRYHVFEELYWSGETQVTKLMEKMEQMVVGNGGRHYEMDHRILQNIETKRTEAKERAKERLQKVTIQREKAHLKSSCIQKLRIMLLGFEISGKSSAGNIILGHAKFDTGKKMTKCQTNWATVAGRLVTVVDTLDWQLIRFWSRDEEHHMKEMVDSMCECTPGPHALLLVINTKTAFTEQCRQSVEDHLKCCADSVWKHSMILFTQGAWLGDTPVEEYIENEGQALQWLVDRCGNRYHVFRNQRYSDQTQASQLFEKIEEMLAENGGCHYEMNLMVSQMVDERTTDFKEKLELRKLTESAVSSVNHARLKMFGQKRLSEIRIVLLGAKLAGKSSAGNTILGREAFDVLERTTKCVMKWGETSDRKITVVDTPGWWMDEPSPSTEEILRGVSLCHPGPHAVLLVVSIFLPYTEEQRRPLEDYLKSLTRMVSRHTIVLFTWGDCIENTTIQQHIERESKALQWLVELCGHRYHVFNNTERGDRTQVAQLLDKVDEMVASNRGSYFSTEKCISETVMLTEDEMRNVLSNWTLEDLEVNSLSRSDTSSSLSDDPDNNFMLVQKQSHDLVSEWLLNNFPENRLWDRQDQEHLEALGENGQGWTRLSEIRIVLLGAKQAGKSSAGNTILGREAFDVLERTTKCVMKWGETSDRKITVVDTPGWWMDEPSPSTEEILRGVSLCHPGPHAVLLVVSMNVPYTEEQRRPLEDYLKSLTRMVSRHTIVLFTWGDCIENTTIQQHIERESKALQWLVELCGHRYHVFNNTERGDRTQVAQLLDKVDEMMGWNGGSLLHYK